MSVQEALHHFAPNPELTYDFDLRTSTGPIATLTAEAGALADVSVTTSVGASAADAVEVNERNLDAVAVGGDAAVEAARSPAPAAAVAAPSTPPTVQAEPRITRSMSRNKTTKRRGRAKDQ